MKKELITLIKKYKWLLFVEIIFLLISVYLTAYPSKIIGQIVDLLYNIEQNKSEIIKLIIVLMCSCLIFVLTRIIWKYADLKFDVSVAKDLQDKLFTKLLKTKVNDLNSIKNGEIMSYFVSDTRKIGRILSGFIGMGVRILAYFCIVMIMMTKSSNFKLTIIAIIPIAVSIIIVLLIQNKVTTSYRAVQKSFTSLSEYVQESTDSIRTMKAFVGDDKQIGEFEKKNNELRTNSLRASKNQNILDICINTGLGFSYAIALLIGSNLVISGEISIGDLIAFNGYLAVLEIPVFWFPWLIKKVKKFKISYERLDKMFSLTEEEIEVFEDKKYNKLNGDIEIKNLTYNYPGYIERVLENVNIHIKQGETLGIIGVIGSGKTTIMNLLLKLYDVENGKIFIDGTDINNIPTKKIRESICYITQDNFLFSTTLKENINLFKDDYSNEEIESSTKKAMIYDDIFEMKDGLNTIIGEKGIDLSGGQKQRVVISRAFLDNSNIIIFDDTFSALDNKTEQHVLNNIKKLTKNKTCIIVSNRISDIKDCDKIIVLEQGCIVESGNHLNLIEKRGKYFEFFQNQAHKTEQTILD